MGNNLVNVSLESLELDREGFLMDYTKWSPEAAPLLAEQAQIHLTEEHWEIIHLVRAYYAKYHVSPMTRVLVKLVGEALGEDKGKSIHLMKLFTAKPAKLVSLIAGLPKPTNCD